MFFEPKQYIGVNCFLAEFTKGLELPQFVIRKISELVFNKNGLLWEDIELEIYDFEEFPTNKALIEYVNDKVDKIELIIKNISRKGEVINSFKITGEISNIIFAEKYWGSDTSIHRIIITPDKVENI